MREIKFRAWNKELNKMLKWEDCEYAEDYEYILFTNEYTSEPMQFTGIKDKNGKEIYEGDIVKIRLYYTQDRLKELQDIGEIKFREGCFVVYLDKNNCYDIISKKVEVIGNIYENPGLLEEMQ